MKISLTRLLNEIKLANKKISKKVNEDVMCFDIMSNARLKHYKSEVDMKTTVDAHLQSITDLITLRDKYKKLLLTANNTVTVKIGDLELTIAEAISKKDTVEQEVSLLRTLQNQMSKVKNKVDSIESENEEKLDNLLRTAMGKDIKNGATEIEAITKAFRDNNKVTMCDPSGTEAYMTKQAEELEDFLSNIDFSLSEINAKTEVEIG